MNTKFNLHLWLLTGRCDGFAAASMNSGVRYRTGDDPAVTAARQFLRLDRSAKDSTYNALALLAAAQASALTDGLPDEQSPIFLPEALPVSRALISGGYPINPDGVSYPSMLHRPTTFPAPMEWTLKDAGLHAVLADDTGRTWHIPVRVDGLDVYPEWPIETGFRFGLRLDAEWGASSEVRLQIPPVSFPFAALARQLQDSSTWISFLTRHGGLESFAAAQLPLFQVGAAARCVINAAYAVTGMDAAGEPEVVESTVPDVVFDDAYQDPTARELVWRTFPLEYQGRRLAVSST